MMWARQMMLLMAKWLSYYFLPEVLGIRRDLDESAIWRRTPVGFF